MTSAGAIRKGALRRTRVILLLLVVFSVFVSAAPKKAQGSAEAESGYRHAVHRATAGAGGASVERAFERANTLGKLLLANDGGELAFMERMSDEEFGALAASLPGMILNREEVLLAHPDPQFFLDLARKHGRAVDVRFFEEYAATFPDGIWPSYVEQQTDFTGCTAFGANQLVPRYAGWLQFRRQYRNAYRRAVAEQLERIEEEVAESTCACGNAEDTLRELEQFATHFPRSSATPEVRIRINELRENRSQIRFECMSG